MRANTSWPSARLAPDRSHALGPRAPAIIFAGDAADVTKVTPVHDANAPRRAVMKVQPQCVLELTAGQIVPLPGIGRQGDRRREKDQPIQRFLPEERRRGRNSL